MQMYVKLKELSQNSHFSECAPTQATSTGTPLCSDTLQDIRRVCHSMQFLCLETKHTDNGTVINDTPCKAQAKAQPLNGLLQEKEKMKERSGQLWKEENIICNINEMTTPTKQDKKEMPAALATVHDLNKDAIKDNANALSSEKDRRSVRKDVEAYKSVCVQSPRVGDYKKHHSLSKAHRSDHCFWSVPKPCKHWIGTLPYEVCLTGQTPADKMSTDQRKMVGKANVASADNPKREYEPNLYMNSLQRYTAAQVEVDTSYVGPYIDVPDSFTDCAEYRHRPSYSKRRMSGIHVIPDGSLGTSSGMVPLNKGGCCPAALEMEKKSYCINCGKYGHLFKKCNFPILSFGLIGYHYDTSNQEVSFIMIQSKNTFHFLDFIRGKYDLNDIESISRLFRNMTRAEIAVLSCKDFDGIWLDTYHDIYVLNDVQENQKKISKTKYEYLMHGYEIEAEFYELNYFLSLNRCSTVEISWSFPKGRRNYKESDLMCAIREFEEETGLKRKYFEIKEPKKIYCETYTGDNSIEYQHRYFLAEFHQKISLEISETNSHQVIEIGMLKWLTEAEAIENINPIYQQRIQIVRSFVEEIQESKKKTSNRRYMSKNASNVSSSTGQQKMHY
jgi:8-oxo-dGTP pyrophosphatase MutT (NUDIX family)